MHLFWMQWPEMRPEKVIKIKRINQENQSKSLSEKRGEKFAAVIQLYLIL